MNNYTNRLRSGSDLVFQANQEKPLSIFDDGNGRTVAARWRHKDCFVPVHNASQYILCYHESGSHHINRFERGKLAGRFSSPGSVTFIPCDGTEWEIVGECQVIHVYLDRNFLAGFTDCHSPIESQIKPFFSVTDPWLESYFRLLLTECNLYGNRIESMLLSQSFGAVAEHLFRFHSTASSKIKTSQTPNAKPIPKSRLRAVVDYINAHFSEDISLKELASMACLSEFHFARCFRESMGVSPYHYVIQKRLEAASKLLTNTDMPIHCIAEAVGFMNNRHFSASFKKWSGQSPRAYRKA